jgi:putative heme-binding domain-containing protein
MPARPCDAGADEPAAADPAAFVVPEGFAVERLFVVPRDELGSWVCLASDPQGRLYASDERDKGLVRITPAPLDGSRPTVVERVPVPLSAAQGLLWAFDSLYVVRNGGHGGSDDNALYRVTDTDGDDSLDTVERLRGFSRGGEHGPHAIVLSPDGKRLIITIGNHTRPPFAIEEVTPPQTMGGIRTSQRRVGIAPEATSMLPANWDEDLVIERLWDAGGHAVGILAPGGFVVATDPAGTSWEILSAGYRNAYDIAFNADGELFAYDSDMEWDIGLPWYRPTRICHATGGSEFGWRSGSGKWPACYPDSLPGVVDIGPGSPVGVTFGYGGRFPAKYQRALYACDWTFGTIHAIHLEPQGATYKATKEEFLSRTPLPLTDLVVGRDGAMYFTVGGRGGQGELYRVRYVGSQPTAPADARQPKGGDDRGLRHALEAFHRRAADPAVAVSLACQHLGHPDRFIRYAARVALEHQPLDLWQARTLALADPTAAIQAAIAVARQAEPASQPAVLAALDRIDLAALDEPRKIDLVRAYQLALVRLGEPPAAGRARIAARFGAIFPTGSFDLDRELSSLLVAVRAPGIVAKLVQLLAAQRPASTGIDLGDDADALRRRIERNADYAVGVRDVLDSPGDRLHVHYAYVLRTVHEKDAWTMADRRVYHAWFGQTREWGGGHSFRKYLTNIENESLAGLSDGDRLALQAVGVLKPYVAPPLPTPEGPGRAWTLDGVLAAAEGGLAAGTRDFDQGKRSFAAARCIVCHRFGNDGGSTGPDLTQAAGRFQVRDLVEAIVDPSKVVSDQYRSNTVQTASGRVVTGRIVGESPERIVVVTDPENATRAEEIPRDDIEEILPMSESLMPKGLLDGLNEAEVLDLLAYVLSKGDRADPRFRR